MNAKFDNLEKSVATLKSENTLLKRRAKNYYKKVEHLLNSINEVRKIAIDSERRNERLEMQSRGDNLKFYGIDEEKNETWADTETKVRHEISRLGLDESSVSIKRAHRLPGGPSPKPIIMKFSFFKDRDTLLATYRTQRYWTQRKGQQGSNC